MAKFRLKGVPRVGDFPTAVDLVMMVAIIVAAQVVMSLIGAWLGLPMPEMFSGDIVDIEHYIDVQLVRGNSFAVIYPLSMILAAAGLYLYIWARDGRGKVSRGSLKGLEPNVILGGVVWLIAMQIVVEPLSVLLPEASQPQSQGLWAIVTAVVFAPVFEEFIFRGIILESLLRRHRRMVSVVVSAALFAIVHFQPAVVFTAFVSGLVLGTIYLHTNSIFATIILHSINNAVAYSLITLNVDNYTFRGLFGDGRLYYTVYGVSLVIAIVAVVRTWRRRRRRVTDKP